ncbi:hypothetical protein BGLA2_1270008 [Burkholderia gladioli]|nr:hypothetical protein BGLA2_1270008 [Burkholderia gladioli]
MSRFARRGIHRRRPAVPICHPASEKLPKYFRKAFERHPPSPAGQGLAGLGERRPNTAL